MTGTGNKINNQRKGKKMIKIDLEKIKPEENYTIREVSEICGVSRSTIMAHIKREHIQSRVIFGKLHISGKNLLDYLNGSS